MGFFSSEWVTTVGTSVSRVVQDDGIIDSVKQGLITGLFSDKGNQLVENVMESVIGGMGVRAERMYSYAKNNYTYGLPTAQIFTTSTGQSVVWGILKSLTNVSIVENYYHFGPINLLHTGWLKLNTTYGYASETNEIAALSLEKGYPVYLKDMVVVVNQGALTERTKSSLDQWGTAANLGYTPERKVIFPALGKLVTPTATRVDPAAATEHVLVTYVWAVPTTVVITPTSTTVINGTSVVTPAITTQRDVVHEATLTLSVAEYDRTQDYFHIKYTDGLKEKYWLYQLGTGTHPEIDTLFDTVYDPAGEFFPVIYFRQGVTNMGTDKEDPGYKTSNKMMKTLGIDYMSIIDAVHENPDISKVEQAMLVFAVPPTTTKQIEQRYLYDFFSKLYLASGGVGVGLGWDIGTVTEDPNNEHSSFINTRELSALSDTLNGGDTGRIRVTVADKRLKTGLSCETIFKKKKAGVVAAVGKYASSFAKETITNTYTKREITGYTNSGGNTEADYGDVKHSFDSEIDVFIYQHQITDSVYEEVKVYDLKLTYYMWGGYYTVGDDQDAILLVPLDHAITRTYGIPDRELLYTRAMHYVFNSRVVTEVKWYQQGWFSFVILVIAVYFMLTTGLPPEAMMQLIAVKAGTMTILQFLISMVITYLPMYLVTSMVMQYFVKTIGAENAFIIAIVAAVVGGYKSFGAGSIAGAPWAQELLALSSNLSSAISAALQDAMIGLKKEADAFSLLMKEKTDLLDSSNKLLEQQTLLSPITIFGESPDDFYNRTVHSGNIGILGIDSIHSYVDTALTLPTFNETIEGRNYA